MIDKAHFDQWQNHKVLRKTYSSSKVGVINVSVVVDVALFLLQVKAVPIVKALHTVVAIFADENMLETTKWVNKK